MNDDNFLDELFSDGVIFNNNNNVNVKPVIEAVPAVDEVEKQANLTVLDNTLEPKIDTAIPEINPQEEAREKEESNIFSKINKLMDVFGFDKNKRFSFKNAEDVENLIKSIKVIKENIKSLKAAFGEEAGEELIILLPEDEDKLRESLLMKLAERLKRIEELFGDPEALEAEEMAFYEEAKHDDLLAIMFLTYQLGMMVNQRLSNKQGNGGGTSVTEGTTNLKEIVTPLDKEEYLKNLYKKLALIEKYTGVTLDPSLIEFFKSDEYIYSDELKLPDILRDEDFERIKNAWSLPVIIEDNREELKSKEIMDAENSISSLETFVAKNGYDTRDNPTIGMLNKLKSDVEEEKNRVSEDNKFFTKEKLKERVECALLYGVKGQTENPKINNLSNALKETITGRINYMKDEQNLRNERKKENNDKTNKDNEIHSDVYHDNLSKANKEVNDRREKRAKGKVTFIPKAVSMKREMNKQNINTAEPVNLDKGKSMVLKNNWNRFNNMAS